MSSMTKPRKAWVLIIVGAVMTLGSGVTGFVWLNRVPDLHPVSFGERLELTATGSGTVTIFTSTGQSSAPTCRVTTHDGGEVVLGEPHRYQQSEGMESSYGFTGTSGTTYTVSCESPGQIGRFAVAEVSNFPKAVFVTVGSLGLLLCAAGGVLAWRKRHTPAAQSV